MLPSPQGIRSGKRRLEINLSETVIAVIADTMARKVQ